ncbi:hypothetical protein PAXINDRAFT_21893 [Paxillus involutus ATCC 200175]|uniref:Uncharacterized protein n=1 Tax=Paxillus involutus ATCC 200175 TaxID=664439 RepID=A0A0C9T062_PAXIN|nr:hypothetical protein PAXINDRAFT_21893 [Paxillus involutus ATCC 200175]
MEGTLMCPAMMPSQDIAAMAVRRHPRMKTPFIFARQLFFARPHRLHRVLGSKILIPFLRNFTKLLERDAGMNKFSMDCCIVNRDEPISLHETGELVKEPVRTVADKLDQVVQVIKIEYAWSATESASRLHNITGFVKELADVIESTAREVNTVKNA